MENFKDFVRAMFGCYSIPLSDEVAKDSCACCTGSKEAYEMYKKRVKLHKRLESEYPEKKCLDTHDGVVYFPHELMPENNRGDALQSIRNSISAIQSKNILTTSIHELMPILKTKSLNLKVKFKKPSIKGSLS